MNAVLVMWLVAVGMGELFAGEKVTATSVLPAGRRSRGGRVPLHAGQQRRRADVV